MNKNDLMEKLIYSLPSNKIKEVTNFLAVKVGNEYFVLKDRFHPYVSSYVTDRIDEDNLIELKDTPRDMYHTYKELFKKNVLLDKRLLHRSGLSAIIEYLESK